MATPDKVYLLHYAYRSNPPEDENDLVVDRRDPVIAVYLDKAEAYREARRRQDKADSDRKWRMSIGMNDGKRYFWVEKMDITA